MEHKKDTDQQNHEPTPEERVVREIKYNRSNWRHNIYHYLLAATCFVGGIQCKKDPNLKELGDGGFLAAGGAVGSIMSRSTKRKMNEKELDELQEKGELENILKTMYEQLPDERSQLESIAKKYNITLN